MNIIQTTFAFLCVGVFLFVWIAPAVWAIGDAQKRGQAGGVVAVLFWLFGPFSALAWLAIRPRARLVDRMPSDYGMPEDAMAAAARLDQLGEWDAAIELYEKAARRWPERRDYAAACLKQIKAKQAL